jgi:hypothetical protein
MASLKVVPPEFSFMISLLMSFLCILYGQKRKIKHTLKQTFTIKNHIVVHIHKIFKQKKYIRQEDIYIPPTKQHLHLKATLQNK